MTAQTNELSAVSLGTTGQGRGVWTRLLRNPQFTLSAGFILLIAAAALLAPLLAGYGPNSGSHRDLLVPLSDGHPLGTDHLGRDVLSRLLYGARVSLFVGVSVALAATVLGVVVGATAGYLGRWVDAVLMRMAEFFQVLPRFVLALIVVAIFGAGLLKIVVVLAVLSWPQTARVVRAGFLALRTAPFVDAARVAGMRTVGIIFREILPNVFAAVVVTTSLDVATAILLETGLGFFGLSDPNAISWGSMLNEAQPYLRQAWWMALFPGLLITIVVYAFNVLGDGLNDELNPRFREQS